MARLFVFARNRLTKFRLTPTSAYDDYTFYTYDHRQRLVAVTFRDGPSVSDDIVQQVEYGYDALKRRNWRAHSIPGVSYLRELYAYDGHDILLEQHQTSPSSFAYFTYEHFWLPGWGRSGQGAVVQPPAQKGCLLLVKQLSNIPGAKGWILGELILCQAGCSNEQ